ncbi:MAG: hypothetical protein ABSE58_07780 [Candidatus Limnocylindrales bacterium]|jgi:DNA-binding transcriptional ArsR family regulator
MATLTWETVERPLLEAVSRLEGGPRGPNWEDLVTETGLRAATVQQALGRLYKAGYIDGIDVFTQDSVGPEFLNISLLEPGLRATGVWPGDPYDAVLAIVARQLEAELDVERKGRLERLRDVLTGVGRDVVTNVLSAWITSAGGSVR